MQRDLVERAQGGDTDAFNDLARAAMDRLYAMATLILRDGDRAQDAVQEALVSAWRDLRALRDPDAFDAWLHRLTVRACYRLARGDRRRSVMELRSAPEPTRVEPFDVGVTLAERDRVERELGRLPLDQRTVTVLHFWLGLPLTESAEILEIPVGTAKSRLHHALVALRRSMADEPGAPRVRFAEGSR
jgi:RNA polymerase sigma-70 factor (ECF subfamily)